MSFSTSSFEQYGCDFRAYCAVLLGVVGVGLLGLLAIYIYAEPLDGDLTRLGWYTERNFGWRGAERRIAVWRSVAATAYERPYDVVVIGDSFSVNKEWRGSVEAMNWPGYVAAITGMSVLTIHIGNVDPLALLESPAFKEHPPQVLIYEGIERYSKSLAHFAPNDRCDYVNKPPRVTFTRTAGPVPTMAISRKSDWWPVNLGYARQLAGYEVLRRVAGIDRTPVLKLPLRANAPFTSRVTDELLIYYHDVTKGRLKQEDLTDATCRLASFAARVEANGRTRFVAMIAPDKLTAYADYLADPELAQLSYLQEFHDRSKISLVPLYPGLVGAIRRGVLDVYHPNNTHWGPEGHRIVADAVINYIAGEDPLR